jgi:hypothetical protein
MASKHVASDNAAAAAHTSARRAGHRWAAALGAGITVTVLASAMMAAGPAVAAAASPGANAVTARTATAATGTPVSTALARLNSPALRRLVPWGRAMAAGASAMMTPQARMAAATNALGFSGALLTGVSCISRSQCTATGMATTRTGKNAKTLAERWNGSTWAVQSTTTPTSRTVLGGALDGGVSCTSATACVADGLSYGKQSERLLGEGWNGHTWTTQPDAAPVVAAEASGISCRWAKDCMAVGDRLSGMTLAEHWNGRKWSALTTKHDGGLFGVSCPATGNCTAVGTNEGGKALAAHWNGKTWSDQSVASPQQLNLLGSVSCTAVKDCVAVGTAGTATSSSFTLTPLAEQWTGGKWAVLTVPDPAPAGDISELNSVSCTSATACMAVGDYMDQTGTSDTTVAAQWNGTTWTVVTTPSPATFSGLLSVSCSSAAHCVAVGDSSTTVSGALSPLTEVWNGTTWTVVTAPR